MATMSILSYNLTQGINMKANNNNNNNTTTSSGAVNTVSSNSQLRKTFNKITVQNVLSENISNSLNISNNSANTIVRKIKDFGMIGTVNNAAGNSSLSASNLNGGSVARKRQLDTCKANAENKPTTQSAPKKPKQAKDATAAAPKLPKKAMGQKTKLNVCASANAIATGVAPPRPMGTPGRKGLPLPQAVARRNARERNRVKQVNNGFAALRDRIPEEVAETFESQAPTRGAAKKLSKVETLRMAVEYIRSLEHLLGFDFPIGGGGGNGGNSSLGAHSSSSGEDSFTLIKDEFDDLSPGLDDNFDDSLSYYDVDEYFGPATNTNQQPLGQPAPLEANADEDKQLYLLPNITTLNGLQYIRIPGTNTYQLITPDIFATDANSPSGGALDEDEKFNALIDTNCLSPGATATTADLNSMSPPTINASAHETALSAPAMAVSPSATLTTISATAALASPEQMNGECGNVRSSSLSRSPVPQTSSSPTTLGASLHHQQRAQPPAAAVALSPAANELLLQACAATNAADRLRDGDRGSGSGRQFVAPTPPQQYLHPRIIKQEYNESDFIVATALSSPTVARSTLIYQQTTSTQDHQQQQQLLLGHATLSMSPPLDVGGSNPTALSTSLASAAHELQSFYEQDPNGNSFHEGVDVGVGIVSFKKELGCDVLLDSTAGTNALSDESMIDAIDWWEAHTPKSDSNSVIL